MPERDYAKVEAGSMGIAYCDRIQEIVVVRKGGLFDHIDRGTSYSLCVEAVRAGKKIIDLIRERIDPDVESIKIKKWY